ncbi:MAG: phage scaffolding protein [Bacillota bacterium]|nr:phage scaffolding protein [Bacillota bacterium]
MDILEFLKKNADAFANIPNAAEVVGNVVAKMQELGFNALANSTKDPLYVPKDQFDQVSIQSKELGKQLDELKKAAKGNDELIKTIDELQGKNKDWETKYKDGMLLNTIKLAAAKANAKDAEDILSLVDRNKLVLKDDNTVEGLDDQIKTLKESKGYLFGEGVKVDGANPGGNGTQTEATKVEADFSAGLKGY